MSLEQDRWKQEVHEANRAAAEDSLAQEAARERDPLTQAAEAFRKAEAEYHAADEALTRASERLDDAREKVVQLESIDMGED